MWQNINGVVVALCVGAIVFQPAAANAQTVAIGSVAPLSTAHTSVRTWTFPINESLASFDRVSTMGMRQWEARSVSMFTTTQARPQLRAPRPPKGTPTQRSHAYRGAQRVLAAFALGFVGFYAGGITAFGFAESCECGGNGTVMIGGAIGAAAGVTTGLLLVR